MKHEWMVDVLADLSAYAERNALAGLVPQLAETIAVAEQAIGRERARQQGGATPDSDGGGIRELHRGVAAGGHA